MVKTKAKNKESADTLSLQFSSFSNASQNNGINPLNQTNL